MFDARKCVRTAILCHILTYLTVNVNAKNSKIIGLAHAKIVTGRQMPEYNRQRNEAQHEKYGEWCKEPKEKEKTPNKTVENILTAQTTTFLVINVVRLMPHGV